MIPLILIVLATGCASYRQTGQPTPETHWAYLPSHGQDLFARFAPIVIPDMPQHQYNRIGKVAARLDEQGREELYVDPGTAVYYVQQQMFHAQHGRYTNLIYRLHFERVPYSLIPFHLTAGKNGGLFIIVTLNQAQQPVLISTVHTCGCYLAFLPTSYLPDDALPEDWVGILQSVYGEQLPRQLRFPAEFDPDYHPVIYLRSGTHRVMDVKIDMPQRLAHNHRILPVEIEPMSKLKHIPLDGGTTSFYATEGIRKGYVKNTYKPFEFLLMSWWALDIHIGVDKELGDSREVGTVFYTSLKPWNRETSDMWHFADFLAFWGWRL